MKSQTWTRSYESRRTFIGGSDARIIMGCDEAALVRLWREKRGEAEPEDLSGNLIVQLGSVTEDLNRTWYERNSGRRVTDVQRRVKHSAIPWMAATLDGIVKVRERCSRPSSCCPGRSPRRQRPKTTWRSSSTTCGSPTCDQPCCRSSPGGKWVEITVPMDPLYLSVLVSAEKKFWRCVQSGEVPHLIRPSGSST
jgi:hypothetical protein